MLLKNWGPTTAAGLVVCAVVLVGCDAGLIQKADRLWPTGDAQSSVAQGAIPTSPGALGSLWILLWSLAGAVVSRLLTAAPDPDIPGLARLTRTRLARGLWLLVPAIVLVMVNTVLDVSMPTAALIGYVLGAAAVWAFSEWIGYRQRALAVGLFGYLPGTATRDELWANREMLAQPHRRARKLNATVVRIRVHGLQPLVAGMDPGPAMQWANAIARIFHREIARRSGIVLNSETDSVLAAWGAPVPRLEPAAIEADCDRAARCALAIATKLRQRNQSLLSQALPTAPVSIGLHAGEFLGAATGPPERRRYRLYGADLEVLEQLEELAREGLKVDDDGSGCRILLSANTLEMLDDDYELSLEKEAAVSFDAVAERVFRLRGRV